MTEQKKRCSKCGESKGLTAFTRNPNGLYGRKSVCKECRKSYDRQYYAADPAARQAAKNSWRESNPEAHRESVRKSNLKWRTANPEAHRENTARWRLANLEHDRQRSSERRALIAGVTIGVVDIGAVRESTNDCYLCGDSLDAEWQADHVIPLTKGGAHCMGNLRPTHALCNQRKSNQLLADLTWYSGPTDLGVMH